MSSTPTLDARLHRAALRLRLERALDSAVLGASVGLALLGSGWLGRAALPSYLPLACAALAAAIAGGRAVARLPILNRLDRSHDLHDLLASAWSFAQLPPVDRSRTTEAVLARAERAAAALDVSRAQPLRAPRRLGLLVCALVFAALAWRGAVRPPPSAAGERAQLPAPRAQLVERLLSAEALAAFRAQLAQLDPEPRADGGAAVLRAELDALLERLAREPMDRLAALRKLRELESRANALAARRATASAGDPEARADAPQIPSAGDDRALVPPPPSAAEPEPKPEPEPQRQAQAPGGTGQPQPSPPGVPGQPGASPPPGGGSTPPGGGSTPPVGGSTPPVGGLPQPIAAAPAGPGKSGDAPPRGPELERRPVPNDPERARGLADAIAELRELLRREPPSDTQARDAPKTPQASQPADDRSDRPGAVAASAAAQKPGSGDAAKPESQASQLPAAAVRIEAEQAGGPLRSQVIYGAAERGFAGRDYARVHAEYEDHAERELERDQLPPGYRGYVRRYFQAIAPRPSP